MEIKHHAHKQPKGQRENHKEIIKYLDINENKNTTCQNLSDTVKAVLRGELTAVYAYIKKEIFQINKLILYLKKVEKPKLAAGQK